MNKNLSLNIYLILISIIIIFFSYFQSLSQSWSSVIDFDLTVIFNSMQVISGYEQDFREHPGYTQFLIYGFFFKLASFFDSNLIIHLDQFIDLQTPSKNLQKLFIISRFANSLFLVLILIFFSKICLIIGIKKNLIIFSLIGILLSSSTILNLLILRADIIAIAFMLIAFYLILSFVKFNKNYTKLFVSGTCILMGLLAKIQAIVLLIPIFFFTPLFLSLELKYREVELNINKYFRYYIFQYIIFVLIYLVLQLYVGQHQRFLHQNYIDLFIFIIFNLALYLFIFFISNKNKQIVKNIFSIFMLIFFGIFCTLFVLLIMSYLEIFILSPYILLRLTNPFYYLKVYSPLSDTIINVEFIYNFLVATISGIKIEIKSFIVLVLVLSYSLWKDFSEENYKNFQCKFIFFISLIVIIFSFNFRYSELYDLYYLPLGYVLICFCLNNYRKFYSILIIFGFIFFNNNFFINKYSTINDTFNRKSNIELICSDRKTRQFFWWWARKLDDNFLRKICLEEGYKFLNNKNTLN